MRIISKFVDYYDGLQAGAHDDRLVYVRNPRLEDKESNSCKDLLSILAPKEPHSYSPFSVSSIPYWDTSHQLERVYTKDRDWRMDADQGLILFCGKPYPFVEFKLYSRNTIVMPAKSEVVYSLESLPKGFEMFESVTRSVWSRRRTRGSGIERIDLGIMELAKEVFWPKIDSSKKAQLLEWAMDNKAPVAGVMYQYPRLARNPWESQITLKRATSFDFRLADFSFARAMPPAQAYQELSMFLGNIAAPDNTPITISDKDRIQQHGFDNMSFRKYPTKHIRG